MFEKNTARGVEDSLLDQAGMFAWGPPIAHGPPTALAFFLDGVRFHQLLRLSPRLFTKRDPWTFRP